MKAIVQTGYGSADVFALREIDKPTFKDNEVLIKVHAVALNSGDYYTMRGVPYMVRLFAGLPKPKNRIPGMDVAGQVEVVGKNVEHLQPGDEVFDHFVSILRTDDYQTVLIYVPLKTGVMVRNPLGIKYSATWFHPVENRTLPEQTLKPEASLIITPPEEADMVLVLRGQ